MQLRTKYGKETYAKIFTSQLTKGEIRKYCEKQRKDMNASLQAPDTDGAVMSADLALLFSAVARFQPVVQPDHYQSGIHWLLSKAYTKTGRQSKSVLGNKFNDTLLRILSGAKQICFVNTEFRLSGSGYASLVYPVYQLRGDYGQFDFYVIPWQSGVAESDRLKMFNVITKLR